MKLHNCSTCRDTGRISLEWDGCGYNAIPPRSGEHQEACRDCDAGRCDACGAELEDWGAHGDTCPSCAAREEAETEAFFAVHVPVACDECGAPVYAPIRMGSADEEVMLCGGCATMPRYRGVRRAAC